MTALRLRVQSKNGVFTVTSLTAESSLLDLQKIVKEKTGIPCTHQKLLTGFPPKELPSCDPGTPLHALGLRSGHSVIAQELQQPRTQASIPSPNPPPQHATLRRKVVPADNSCLFKCMSVLFGGQYSNVELRELVAGIITSDPGYYSTALLGRPNSQYVEWILRTDSWGGAIELSVFSEHFETEIDVVDVQTQRIDKFGEEKGFSRRGMVIYDGIHYDPLVLVGPTGDQLQTTFPMDNDAVLVEGLEIAKEAFKANQYTDIGGFLLKCLVCGKRLTGQVDATTHANETGHINFSEIT